MTGPAIKGWCPSLFEPMASGDGLLVRVKPRVGGVSADQARALAAAAERYGSGRVDLTNRANLQIRGLSAATAPLFAEAMVEVGLASPDPAAERRRNIQVAISDDPRVLDLAVQLERWLDGDAALAPLPAKFDFAVSDGAGADDGPTADIEVVFSDQPPSVVLAGAAAATLLGRPLAAAQALTHAFLGLASETSPPPRRMRSLIAVIGAPAIFARAGVEAIFGERPVDPPSARALTPTLGVLALSLPFGAADSGLLRAAADLAERFGDGRLLTRGRELMLKGVPADAADLTAAAVEAGFIVDRQDPRLRIAACVGKPACARAATDVRATAGRLAEVWRGDGVLHVSGCAKGCAHPGPASVALVATAEGYDMVLDGRAGDLPQRMGLSLAEAAQIIARRGACAA